MMDKKTVSQFLQMLGVSESDIIEDMKDSPISQRNFAKVVGDIINRVTAIETLLLKKGVLTSEEIESHELVESAKLDQLLAQAWDDRARELFGEEKENGK